MKIESLVKPFSWFLVIAMAAVLAWQAGKIVWQVWLGAPAPITLPGGTGLKGGGAPQDIPTNYVGWKLFGKAETNLPQSLTQVEAPETKLRLELYGVVVDSGEQGSGAIVAERGKPADYYRIGERLPGNAELTAVYPDHILLSRNGVLEKLLFQDKGDNRAKQSTSRIAAVKKEEINSPEEFLEVAQERLERDPRAALASVGLSPADGGNGPAGYVFNGRNPMLAAMNLQKGDVIRSVNGMVLGNIEQDRAMLEQLYESGMLEVEIEREGATFTVNYPIR